MAAKDMRRVLRQLESIEYELDDLDNYRHTTTIDLVQIRDDLDRTMELTRNLVQMMSEIVRHLADEPSRYG